MTADLLRLSDWLGECGVTHVAMESTGVYWKPIFNLLESTVTVWVLNAQHVKRVPGRKTDVADAHWLADLLRHGLVQPSFIPPQAQRDLRDLTRERTNFVREQFPTVEQAAARAGVAPGNNESAGKRRTGRTRKGNPWLRLALVQAARGALRKKQTYLAAQYRRIAARWGPNAPCSRWPTRSWGSPIMSSSAANPIGNWAAITLCGVNRKRAPKA
jgi:transposase